MANEEHLARLKEGLEAWNQWRKRHCSILWQRCGSAFQQVWETTAPTGSKVLRTIEDTSKKTGAHLRATPWQVLALQYRPVLLGVGGLLLLLAIWKIPQWQAARWEGRINEAKEIAKLENDARTILVQAIGGAVVFIGLWVTWRNMRLTEKNIQITQETALRTFETTREGQITDRFTKAINQLGETGPEKLAIRLGGIYALVLQW